MTETDVSRRVDKVAVRVVQRGFERVFSSGFGELRTYDGSRLILKKISHWIVNIF
jgi:hypothetical protein